MNAKPVKPGLEAGIAKILRKGSLDVSAVSEMVNYSRHLGVEDLSDSELEIVVERLGEEALAVATTAGRSAAGGGDVRAVILRICNDGFGDCRQAARAILKHNAHLSPEMRLEIARELERLGIEGTGPNRIVTSKELGGVLRSGL